MRSVPGAFGREVIHGDQGVSRESRAAVVQGEDSWRGVGEEQNVLFLFFHVECKNRCASLRLSESVGVGGEGVGDVPQILGRVQQRGRLYGLLVQVTRAACCGVVVISLSVPSSSPPCLQYSESVTFH